MLLTKELEIELSSSQIKYYSNLGYDIPRVKDKYSRYTTPRGTKIIVKIEDLQKGSHENVQYQCDICGEIVTCQYKTYIQSQIKSYTKIDVCNNCKFIKSQMSIKNKYGVDNLLLLPEIRQKSYDKNRHSFEFICEQFDKLDYILITKEYKNNLQSLDYICRKHIEYGIQTTNYANIQHHGSACRLCANEKISESRKNIFENVKNEYFSLGYNLLSSEDEYIDCHTPLKCSCMKHPEEFFGVSLVHARRHLGCNKCFRERVCGENSWNWKGGITSLSQHLRYKTKIWTFDSLKNTKFKCVLTNIENGKLVVHHLYSFSKIMEELLEITGIPLYSQISLYSLDELKILEDKCLELNYRKGLGIPLIRPLHNLFHSQMGSVIIDNGEFQEFAQRYYNFEFDDQLEEKYKYKTILLKKTG